MLRMVSIATFLFCSLMKISDGRTRMSPTHTKVSHSTVRDGSGDLLKHIVCLILLSSQRSHQVFTNRPFFASGLRL